MPSCQLALSLQRPPRALRIQVPLPTSSRVKIWPAVKPPRSRLPAASAMPVPAAFTSRRTVPSPDSGPTVTSMTAPAGGGDAGDRAGQAAGEDRREVARRRRRSRSR